MLSSRRRLWAVLLACCIPQAAILAVHLPSRPVINAIISCICVCVAGFYATAALIPRVKHVFVKANLQGKDLNKKGTAAEDQVIPESLGLIVGCVYFSCAVLFQLVYTVIEGRRLDSDGYSWLVQYNGGMASICFMLLLGFADDVLDIPWRYKILMPMLASLPLLVSYSGPTTVVIPRLMRGLQVPVVGSLPHLLELGPLYKAAMALVTVFCTNSINILAGVNGLEAGQTAIISASILAFNLLALGQGWGRPDAHLVSVFLVLPLFATTGALLQYNWFPAKVFVGDTYTYFAGMVLAVAGILGHFPETLLLFFIPQLFNFAYSLPQLLKIVPCPRHRLGRLDPKTGLLHATNNYNLLNFCLWLFGPCEEEVLSFRLLCIQGICCLAAFGIRHVAK
ncbi:unnamed protein product [Pedinophyceae sp. YPF-701]|nr:unnamed protein product [Pedinophyceae sp. YPF-701]